MFTQAELQHIANSLNLEVKHNGLQNAAMALGILGKIQALATPPSAEETAEAEKRDIDELAGEDNKEK